MVRERVRFTGAFLVNAIPAVVALGLVVSIRETLPSRRALRGDGSGL